MIHIAAHFFNINSLVNTTKPQVIVEDDETAENIAFTTVAGITGVVITVCLILMVTTASEQIRRSYFELFWYTHHLFIGFYVALILHGTGGFVQRQTNYEQCPISEETGRTDGNCPVLPEFQSGSAASWMFVVGPLSLYLLERLYRLYTSQFRRLKILKIIKHQDVVPVMEVQFQKISTEAGQVGA